jgi:hypothetical protein
MLDDATATNFSTYLSPRRAQDFQNMAAEWASPAVDQRQLAHEEPGWQLEHFGHLHLSVA